MSQDPIRLLGNNPTIYAYTHDVNSWIDPFGLDYFRGSRDGDLNFDPRDPVKTKKGWRGDYRLDADGNVATTHGVSVFDNANSVTKKGFDANKITEVPDTLDIIQRGNDPHHYEIVPKKPMPPADYKAELDKIKCD